MNKGKLFMLPVPIADGVLNDTLPEHTIQTARELKFFLAENAKSARAFLKFCGHPSPIASLSIEEIGHRPDSAKVRGWLKPALEGNDIGIVSEAGCPGVADPGAQIAAEAHKLGIRVVPLVGPSSILLALMASGMDGQHFRFCGYLPIKEPARTYAIKDLVDDRRCLGRNPVSERFRHFQPERRVLCRPLACPGQPGRQCPEIFRRGGTYPHFGRAGRWPGRRRRAGRPLYPFP